MVMNSIRDSFKVPVLVAALLVGFCVAASATELHMSDLPSAEIFGCAICHVSSNPTSADLNVFGVDYADHLADLADGETGAWDLFLAGIDSDQDGCTNGLELGDVDGNGLLDEGVLKEGSNPGLPGDCQSINPLDPSTWGALKAMFDTR